MEDKKSTAPAVWPASLLLTLAALLTGGCGRGRPLAEDMNVLLVTLDTTRADYLSPYGADPRITPHLQAFADRSCLFTGAASETNVTNPSHLSIMTGLPAIEHGVISNRVPMPESVDTLAAAMQRAGYRTAGIVAVPHLWRIGWRAFDFLPEVAAELEAAEITDRAAARLAEDADRPFFLWVHYFDPHIPYQPPPDIAARFYQGDPAAGDEPPIAALEFFDRWPGGAHLRKWLGETRDPEFPRAMYAAELHYTDREIGRLLTALERAGRDRDTVVVVIADHGESLGEHRIYYHHSGLYEQQLRIPLIIHVPGLEPTRSSASVSTLDLAPTISELTSVRLRHQPSGRSLVPLLLGRESPDFAARSTFVHQNAHNHAVALRQGPWKLIWPINTKHPHLPRQPQLYHLQDDPEELVDLAAAQPERVRSMRRQLQPWIELGRIERDGTPHLDDDALDQLRSLGYLGD